MFGKNKETTTIREPLEIFTIHDSKTGTYDIPSFALNKHDMTRAILNMFKDRQQRQNNRLWLNAEDFSLFKIGSYDKRSGQVQSDILEHIANLQDLRAIAQAEEPAVPMSTQAYRDQDRALSST